MSSFNLDKFSALFEKRNDQRQDIVKMARIAEAAERYEDMCKFMRKLVNTIGKNEVLTVEERNLLSVAYKNVIGTRRASWRTLSAEDSEHPKLIELYKAQVETELATTCQDVLELLDILAENTSEDDDGGEPLVFYLKMKGDYYRYLAESKAGGTNEQQAADNYKRAFDLAVTKLKPTHPIRLGLALNYSVCHYEILKDKSAACELAKKAFDEAISKLDKLEEADYKDSTLIMQLLRDNLTLWTSSDGDENERVQVEDFSDDEN